MVERGDYNFSIEKERALHAAAAELQNGVEAVLSCLSRSGGRGAWPFFAVLFLSSCIHVAADMGIAGTRRAAWLKLEQAQPPPASQNNNSCRSYPCSTPSPTPTLVVIGIGMSAMIVLVLTAIILLCRSHIMYRRRMERHRQAAVVASETMAVTTGRGLDSSTDEGANGNNSFLLVLFPGEKYPVTCAHISPLHEAAVEASTMPVEPSTTASSPPATA
ncbi:hypothetical protein GOP47_0021740 [Adiantum capillus-veneris]|uniref:Uncharacterized protein n=1 Tax=Adiantum capillus-veneris TaxID=13818 RepID=A0A9D4U823_ADICA|nr:hypothetical protein GOP47_0021740 [Adiantum capillus-veneris]